MAFKTKQDQVADILRARIISEVYPRGTKLKQSDIAKELGVSITPVREALHMLGAEGYVEAISHKGLIVPLVQPETARETLELRLMLERDLTARALERMDALTLTAMRESQRVIAQRLGPSLAPECRFCRLRACEKGKPKHSLFHTYDVPVATCLLARA
jgi:DNA-binding GntR family transcriptional regulator